MALSITIAMFLMAGAPLGALVALGAVQVEALLVVAATSFILAGISLVKRDMRACGNYLAAAFASLGILAAVIAPVTGAAAAVIGIAVLTNDTSGRMCS